MKKKKRAFTLIELMIVIAIIGILAAIAVPNFTKARKKARAKSCAANIKTLENALEMYDMDHPPTSGGTTVISSGTVTAYNLVSEGYIQKFPRCPTLNTETAYQIRMLGAGFEVYCSYHGTISEIQSPGYNK